MKKVLGIVQESMFDDDALRRFEAGVKQTLRGWSDERFVVIWMVMPPGYAFSERKPSQAVILMVEVDDGTDQGRREELMGQLSQHLMDNFAVSPLDSLITVADSAFVNAFFDAQRARIDPAQRLRIHAKLYGSAVLSKVRRGTLQLPVDLA